ncbi:MAG: hypothetical protein JWN24_1879 [Phycisphaerales bacterium]|nr:hypothetical protein [Phycisphaerales bacterium]
MGKQTAEATGTDCGLSALESRRRCSAGHLCFSEGGDVEGPRCQSRKHCWSFDLQGPRRRDRSAYHVHGLLAAMIGPPLSRCQIQTPLAVDQARLMEIKDAVAALVACAPVIEFPNAHPWRNCLPTSRSLNLQDDVKHHFSRFSNLLFERLESIPKWRSSSGETERSHSSSKTLKWCRVTNAT